MSRLINKDVSMVTYDLSGGRFGDGLVSYFHGKWLSYRYGIPLLFNPFPLSEYLNLSAMEVNPDERHRSSFKEVVHLISKENIERLKCHQKEENILYVVPYYSEFEGECNHEFFKKHVHIEWQNESFRNLLLKHIDSDHAKPRPVIFQDMVNIALHVRTGRGFDNLASPGEDYIQALKNEKQFCNIFFPLKLPAMNYFSNALHQCCLLLGNEQVHVHVFTDDVQPVKVLNALQDHMNLVEHDCSLVYTHGDGSQKALSIIEDFLSMTHFDCLIRPASNFSFAAAKISDFHMEISPKRFVALEDFFFVNALNVQCHDGREFEISIPYKMD